MNSERRGAMEERRKLRPSVPLLNQEEDTKRAKFWRDASTEDVKKFLTQLEKNGEGEGELARTLKKELSRRAEQAG
jgi:hypothetical protein